MAPVGDIRRDKGSGGRPTLRSDGRWQAQYTAADGRRRYVYARDPKTCAKLRDDAIKAAGVGINPTRVPLADYIARHLDRRARNLSPESMRRYRSLARHVSESPQGRIALQRLRADDLDDLYAAKLAEGMAPKGIELLHTVIHGALAVAAKRGHVLRNEADLVERPKVRRVVRDVYSAEQIRALLDAAEGRRLDAFVAVLGTTGLRHGELLGLRWRDVDLDGRRLILANPEKGGVPRTVLLAPRVVRALRAHKARQNEQRLAAAGAYDETGLVFANHWGQRADPKWMREQLASVATAANLPPVTPRQLRHAVATALIEAGVPVKVVQELLGHRTFKQTSDTYAHVSPTMLEGAVRAMGKVVGE